MNIGKINNINNMNFCASRTFTQAYNLGSKAITLNVKRNENDVVTFAEVIVSKARDGKNFLEDYLSTWSKPTGLSKQEKLDFFQKASEYMYDFLAMKPNKSGLNCDAMMANSYIKDLNKSLYA